MLQKPKKMPPPKYLLKNIFLLDNHVHRENLPGVSLILRGAYIAIQSKLLQYLLGKKKKFHSCYVLFHVSL